MRGRRTALTFIVTLLVSAVALAMFLNVAVANFIPEPIPSGIRINSDGTVEGTNSIHRSGNVYTLTGDIYRTIVILLDDIVLDGAGYTLQGNGDGSGIFIQERSGVIIKNLKICGFDYGIKFTWLNFGTTSPRHNKVSGNTIINNTCGIAFYDFSSGNEVSDNYIADNTYGVVSALGIVFENNQFNNNDGAISERSFGVINNIDTSNTINGKPIYYWVRQHDRTVPSDAGWVVLKNCSRITIQDLSLNHNVDGILLCYTIDSTVSRNLVTNNLNGITIIGSSNNVVSDNHVGNNNWDGISLGYGSGHNVISRNKIVANVKDGVCVESSANNNTVTKNLVMENNGNGVFFSDIQDSKVIENTITLNKGCGIGFGYGPNGIIMGNYISRNGLGIWISNAVENAITWNTIVENDCWGIRLEGAQKNNVIHHNNFINNSVTESLQASILGVWTYPGLDKPLLPDGEREPPKLVDGATNFWDDGRKGNYWSDYNGNDNDGDRIGDSPYVININNQDNYPLMEPVEIEVLPEFPSGLILIFILVSCIGFVLFKKAWRSVI